MLLVTFILGHRQQKPPPNHTAAHATHALSVKALRIHGFPSTCFYADTAVPPQFQWTSSTTHRVFAIVTQIVASNTQCYKLPVSTEVNSLCNKEENNKPEVLRLYDMHVVSLQVDLSCDTTPISFHVVRLKESQTTYRISFHQSHEISCLVW